MKIYIATGNVVKESYVAITLTYIIVLQTAALMRIRSLTDAFNGCYTAFMFTDIYEWLRYLWTELRQQVPGHTRRYVERHETSNREQARLCYAGASVDRQQRSLWDRLLSHLRPDQARVDSHRPGSCEGVP